MIYNRFCFFCLNLLLIFLVGCSSGSSNASKQSELPKSSIKSGNISMPSGWDDSTIDKIKSGEPIKKVLAVLDFEGYKFLKGKADLKMSDMLTTSLVKSNRFEMVERNKIDKVFKEQNLGMTGMIDESSAAEVGKLLGAEYIVFGSITYADKVEEIKFSYKNIITKITIDVRAVNTTTGKILLSESSSGKVVTKVVTTGDGQILGGMNDWSSTFAEAARKAIENVSVKISKLEPLVGFVISADSNQTLIDVGEDQGVNIGDVFVAFSVGDEILHPATGKRIGWKKEILREVEIISTEKTMSNVKTIKTQSNKQLQPGDYVISR